MTDPTTVSTERELELFYELEQTMTMLAAVRRAYESAREVVDEDYRYLTLMMSEHRILHARKVLYGDDVDEASTPASV